MKLNFVSKDNLSKSDQRKTSQVCNSAVELEELILGWIALYKELKIDTHKNLLGIEVLEFTICKRTFTKTQLVELAVVEVVTKEICKLYPGIPLVSQAILSSPDSHRVIADDSWFEQRDNMLGVYFHEKYGLDIIPRESFVKFILSYLLSGSAYVEITQAVYPNMAWVHVFYQEDSKNGWGEYLAFYLN